MSDQKPVQKATAKSRCAHHEFTAAGTWWRCENRVDSNKFYCEKCKREMTS